MAFQSQDTVDPVLRVQVKEILEHTFQGVIDHNNKLEINITGKLNFYIFSKKIENNLLKIHFKDQYHFNVQKMNVEN
jgi:hypothetical protein